MASGEIIALASRGPRQACAVEGPHDAVVADPSMVEVHRMARRLAATSTTVLLLGESGSGKEILAEQIHRHSDRSDGPFVRLNCAALADTLLESELFGHERGAFTGADRRRIGYLEAAHGGTLLLDEIGELPFALQAKLLRVLETRRVVRLGTTQEIDVDLRFVCATHRDLRDEMARGRFRHDLYFRIGAATLRIPPLRERPAEIAALAERFAAAAARRTGRACAPGFEPDTTARLLAHGWPGNVRELKHAIEFAVVMSDGEPIAPRHLPDDVRTPPPCAPATAGMRGAVDALERAAIVAALEHEDGNQTRAARRLGISRRNLVYKLGKYELRR